VLTKFGELIGVEHVRFEYGVEKVESGLVEVVR
jgi:hypothetical protein